jgi:hypothetical protein
VAAAQTAPSAARMSTCGTTFLRRQTSCSCHSWRVAAAAAATGWAAAAPRRGCQHSR